MADGMAKNLAPACSEPWQQPNRIPAELIDAAQKQGVELDANAWSKLDELERFALCKLARPGHDHHNLPAAFSEVLG